MDARAPWRWLPVVQRVFASEQLAAPLVQHGQAPPAGYPVRDR